jgi:hypothetical protein
LLFRSFRTAIDRSLSPNHPDAKDYERAQPFNPFTVVVKQAGSNLRPAQQAEMLVGVSGTVRARE